jgi:hypothetical protein
MKINGKLMMAVVMVVGSLAATGCSTASAADTGPVAPEETAATAPVDNDSAASTTSGVEKDARFFHYYAPHAPPAARFEIAGRAPSARHFWAPGYYRYNGREHVWVGDQRRREGFVRHPLLRSLRSARGPLRVPRRRPERAALLGARLLPLQRPRARLGRRPVGAPP